MKKPARNDALVVVALVLLLTAVCPPNHGIADETESSIDIDDVGVERSYRVWRYVLDNGLTVILEQNKFSPVAALMLWVKVGSADEAPGEYGLAHVHEHMLFKGTEKYGVGEIAKTVEAAGGDINAYTSHDETVYYLVLPSKRLELGLDVLSDVVFRSTFNPDELDKELKVVLEEIKRGYDNPSVRLAQAMFDTAYKVHPYKRPIIGYEETVSSFTRDQVVEFYRKWYTPDNMVLVAVGDFDIDRARRFITGYFGGNRRVYSRSGPRGEHPVEPKQKKPRFTILRGDVSQGYMEIAFHIPRINHEDIPALDIMSYILGTGESSRLYRRVQSEKGLVHTIGSYTYTPKDPGLAMVTASLDPKNTRSALDAILREVARLKSEPPRTGEMNIAKTNIQSEAVYSTETVQGEARKLGFYETVAGDAWFEEKYMRGIEAVSADDVMRVARKYFVPSNVTVGVYLPETSDIKNIDKPSLEGLVRKALGAKDVPFGSGGVRKVVLSNGMTVLIKERHEVPIVAYRLVMLGGVRFEPAKYRGMNQLIARMIAKGTAKRSAEEISADAESMAGSVGGFSGRDSTGVQGEFLSRYFDRGFELFCDVALNPTFPLDKLEQQKREIIADIRRLKDRPAAYALDVFRRKLFPNHPYGSRVLGEEKTVKNISRKILLSYYRDLIVPRNMVLAVVGDVSPEDILPRIKRQFEDIPSDVLRMLPPPAEKAPTRIVREQISVDRAQTQIVLGFMGPPLRSKDRFAVDVLANVLGGQGGRLFFELRDKKHLAYSVGAASVEALDAGMFFLYIGTGPDNRKEALDGLIEEVERVRREPVLPEELERAKEYVAGSYEISLQTAASQATNLALSERYGLGWEESLKYPEKVRAVTADDVWRAARKYLRTDRYILVELLPEAGESE